MMRRMLTAVVLAISLTACESIAGLEDDGAWDFTSGTDQISHQPQLQARLDAYVGGETMTLVVRCVERKIEVLVSMSFITEVNGSVRYRIDDGSQVVQIWTHSTNVQALFFQGDARGFADQLAVGGELVFATREWVGPEHTVTFRLRGLDVHLPAIKQACA